MNDSSICVCVITAGLIGREEHWDIVITDTPVQTLTHADGGMGRGVFVWKGSKERWKKGCKERKNGMFRSLFVCFMWVWKQFACYYFGYRF